MKLLPKFQGIGCPIPFKFDLKMRLATLSLLIPLIGMYAKPSHAQQTISLNVKDVTVLSVLESIEKNSDYRFVYKIEDVDLVRALSLNVKKEKIPVVLDKIFKSTDVNYKILGNQVFLNKPKGVTFKTPPIITTQDIQQIEITGTVTDEDGVPILGVNIIVEGTSRGTSTDFDGNYVILVNKGDVLRFSSVGFEVQTIVVTDQTQLNVSLTSGSALDEVVVIGFGSQRQGSITSAVTQIKSESVQDLSALSPDELIQGRAAGVEINSSGGVPGSGLSFKIRGASSISGGSSPLYVIDGIPAPSGSHGLSTGGDTTNPLAFLNPADIESMTVLKDAAATAIYGANATNGVILIQTKKGRRGKTQIQFRSSVGIQSPVNKLDITSGPEFEMLMNEAARINGQPEPYSNPENAINTNWNDYIFRTSITQDYNISLSGNEENVSYYVSGNHVYDKGSLNPLSFERSSIRSKIDLKVTNWLKLGTNVNYSDMSRNRRNDNDGTSGRGVVGGALWFLPNLPVYQPDGSYTRFTYDDNPLSSIKETSHWMKTNKFVGTVSADVDIAPGLTGHVDWTYDKTNVNEEIFLKATSQYGEPVNGDATSSYFQLLNTIAQTNLHYQKDFDKHFLDFVIGASTNYEKRTRTTATGQEFPDDDLRRIESAAVRSSTSNGSAAGLVSTFGRVQYDYDGRYLATATLRYDGSSRFGKDKRWGAFPSFSLGWNVAEESFFSKFKSTMNNLKIRGSYGITGNQSGIDAYASLGLWNGQSYGGSPGLITDQLANPALKWEVTHQLNFGLDFGLFNNRVSVTYDYYTQDTKDLLYATPVPQTSGYQSVTQNIGELSNKGMELTVSAEAIQGENFNWNINFNIAGNRNKITKLPSSFTTGLRDIFLYQEGIPMFSFYTHKQLGVDPDTGAVTFADIDGDGVFNASSDRTIVGNANPDFFGGITNSFKYKLFDFSFHWYFKYGNKQANMNRYFAEHGGLKNQNFYHTQLDRWQKPGDQTDVPRMASVNYPAGVVSSRFVEDGSYMRLTNITLGYRLNEKALEKLGLTQARFYITGQNLITITNYSGIDPELTSSSDNPLVKGWEFLSIPHSKSINFGINLTL